jgi:hypothetical protein
MMNRKEGAMSKITIKLKTPKARNALAHAVLDPQSIFRPKSERDRSKYSRKVKHKKGEF